MLKFFAMFWAMAQQAVTMASNVFAAGEIMSNEVKLAAQGYADEAAVERSAALAKVKRELKSA